MGAKVAELQRTMQEKVVDVRAIMEQVLGMKVGKSE
jgi:hypothetical protein